MKDDLYFATLPGLSSVAHAFYESSSTWHMQASQKLRELTPVSRGKRTVLMRRLLFVCLDALHFRQECQSTSRAICVSEPMAPGGGYSS